MRAVARVVLAGVTNVGDERMKTLLDDDMKGLGEAYVRLGVAMQEEDATLVDLASLARDCGLLFQVRLVPVSREEAKGD